MKIIKKLPYWVLTNPSPAFYETESGTSVEQTAIIYKKMEELIEHYNSFIDDINHEIEEFTSEVLSDQEEFETKINQMIYDFTSLVELKLNNQDTDIKNAIDYMKTHLDSTINEMLLELFESEQVKLNFEYNTETESLDITGVVVTERSGE